MTHDEIVATGNVCLLAAVSDGAKHHWEREQIRQGAQGLAGDQAINLQARCLPQMRESTRRLDIVQAIFMLRGA